MKWSEQVCNKLFCIYLLHAFFTKIPPSSSAEYVKFKGQVPGRAGGGRQETLNPANGDWGRVVKWKRNEGWLWLVSVPSLNLSFDTAKMNHFCPVDWRVVLAVYPFWFLHIKQVLISHIKSIAVYIHLWWYPLNRYRSFSYIFGWPPQGQNQWSSESLPSHWRNPLQEKPFWMVFVYMGFQTLKWDLYI